MKQVIFSLAIIVSLISCESKSGQKNSRKTMAKLEVATKFENTGVIRTGDIVVRYVDTLYNVGDIVRFDDSNLQFRILRMESKAMQGEVAATHK